MEKLQEAEIAYLRSLLRKISIFSFFRFMWKATANSILFVLALICGIYEVTCFYVRQRVFRNVLPNYHTVADSSLYRGGQPSNAGLRELAKKGVKTIINLRTEDFNRRVIEEYYKDKIRTVHLPFYPYEPQDQIMINFLRIMLNPKYQPVYVHCFHGADRTGTVCAIYRIIMQNWDKEDAIAEMVQNGLHWWHKHLIDYIRGLDVEKLRGQIGEITFSHS